MCMPSVWDALIVYITASHTVFYILSAHDVISAHPLLRPKVMWKGIYIYSIRPASTARLLLVLETMTAGK